MADLRYVKIPASVDVTVGENKWSFFATLCHVVDSHPSFNTTGTGVRAAARIVKLFDGKAVGDVVALDEADWKLLNGAFESPAAGYVPPLQRTLPDKTMQQFVVPSRAFLPYIEAVSDEQTKKASEPKVINGAEEASLASLQVS